MSRNMGLKRKRLLSLLLEQNKQAQLGCYKYNKHGNSDMSYAFQFHKRKLINRTTTIPK